MLLPAAWQITGYDHLCRARRSRGQVRVTSWLRQSIRPILTSRAPRGHQRSSIEDRTRVRQRARGVRAASRARSRPSSLCDTCLSGLRVNEIRGTRQSVARPTRGVLWHDAWPIPEAALARLRETGLMGADLRVGRAV